MVFCISVLERVTTCVEITPESASLVARVCAPASTCGISDSFAMLFAEADTRARTTSTTTMATQSMFNKRTRCHGVATLEGPN